MQSRHFGVRLLVLVGCIWALLTLNTLPAQAVVDPYVLHYLKAPVDLPIRPDELRSFSVEDLSEGKILFGQHCSNCHVGGSTLPDPTVSLSLDDLRGATPPRDTISSLITYLRQPMTYDGSEETFWCRQIPESWLSQPQVEKLAGFVLRAAQVAPGWGTEKFGEDL